jgi:hypothetical protein
MDHAIHFIVTIRTGAPHDLRDMPCHTGRAIRVDPRDTIAVTNRIIIQSGRSPYTAHTKVGV